MKALMHDQIHATCVLLDSGAVLLRGPSGAGKSDLALRLIDKGARLVADDRVDLRWQAGQVTAGAPAPLQGLIEVRGIGLVRMPSVDGVPVVLVADLVAPAAVERMPERDDVALLGTRVERVAIDPFEISAPVKLMLAAKRAAERRTAAAAA